MSTSLFQLTSRTICIVLVLSSMLKGQEEANYASLINTSDDNGLFLNPAFIDSLIKDKSIILLGELDHGDGTSLEIKTKLVKYLHEKHGFNNFVFESGLINCDQLWNETSSQKTITESAKDHIYYIWSEVQETEQLFQYLDNEKKLKTPMRLLGIDPQFSGRANENAFLRILSDQLDIEELQSQRFKEFSYELKLISQWMHFPNEEEHQITEDQFYTHLDYYHKDLLTKVDNPEIWNLYCDNLSTLTKLKWVKREGSFELRDQKMFENFKYWVDNNQEQKFIVWAANAHIIRNDKQLKGKDSDYGYIGLKKLGDYIYEAYPAETYSIAFASRKGKTLNFLNKKKSNKIKTSNKESLEEKMKHLECAFIDLQLYESKMNLTEYASQLFYPNISCTALWSNHFDGVIFIDEMKPSTAKWK